MALHILLAVVEYLLNRCKSVLRAQMIKSLGKSVINLYPNVACSVLGIGNQQDLSDDLECDPFLNSAMQRFTCDLYYSFGTFLVSVGIITGKHYAKILALNLMTDQTMKTVNQQKQETVTKQKCPLRIEQGKRLIEYNCCKKEELKR